MPHTHIIIICVHFNPYTPSQDLARSYKIVRFFESSCIATDTGGHRTSLWLAFEPWPYLLRGGEAKTRRCHDMTMT